MSPGIPRPRLLPLELTLIAGIFRADAAGHVPLSKTPFLLLVAWGSMWLLEFSALCGYRSDPTDFNDVVGDLELLLLLLALNWILAAFGEEMVWADGAGSQIRSLRRSLDCEFATRHPFRRSPSRGEQGGRRFGTPRRWTCRTFTYPLRSGS